MSRYDLINETVASVGANSCQNVRLGNELNGVVG